MRRQVEEAIIKHGLLQPGGQVLAAVSGGADSVCLLYVLAQMREEWSIELKALHVHHGLRGEEADRDAAFTKALCGKLSVQCSIRYVDVHAFSEEKKLSEEEAARELRYQVLEEAADQWERQSGREVRIAVAHHGDDNVETILHNLFRGSGLKGLGGISPMRGRIIRPLLTLTRQEILRFLKEEGVGYCQDQTNLEADRTRNKLRLKVLPMICSDINVRAGEHILQAAERMRQADRYLEQQAALWLRQYGILEDGQDGQEETARSGADAKALRREPAIIQTYVIRQMIGDMTGSKKDITSVHVEEVRELLEKQAGRQADLPYGLMARRTYDHLWIERKDGQKKKGDAPVPKLVFETFFYEKGMEIPKNQYTKWFDHDKINGMLSVRTRQTGDYLLLPGGGHKTIKSYLIDEKVPSHLRDQVFLLADGSHILWVIGRRISEGCKVTEKTKRILQVHMSGGEEDGR